MASNIGRDSERFKQIIKGKVRKNLQDLIKRGGFNTKRGKDTVVVPVPNIELPRFKHGKNEDYGVGQGKGEEGDALWPGDGEGEEEGPKAGEEAGEHQLEMTVEEAAELLGEGLELPRIEPRGRRTILQEFDHYHGLRRHGPSGLLRFKPTYKNAMTRMIASGEYNPDEPVVPIIAEDMRFRSWKTKDIPESSAVIIYLMDVSGSMSERHKSIARRISFWTDIWLRAHYKGLESVYIIHDYDAKEVDEHTFYHTITSGGTRIASGYLAAEQIISTRYDSNEWNIYLFQYSDGDNWGGNDNEMNILGKSLLQKLNLLCYAQIDIPYWYTLRFQGEKEGEYLKALQEFAKESEFEEKVLTARLKGEEDILPAIKTFLGTGK